MVKVMAIIMAFFMLPACVAQATGRVEIGGVGSTRMIRTLSSAKAGEHSGQSRLIRSERQVSLVAKESQHVQGRPTSAEVHDHPAHSDVFCNSIQFDDDDNNYEPHIKIQSVSNDAHCCTLCRLHDQCHFWIRIGQSEDQELCWCKEQDHMVATSTIGGGQCKAMWKAMVPCKAEFDYLPGEVLAGGMKEIDFPEESDRKDDIYNAACCNLCLNEPGCKYWQRQAGVQKGQHPAQSAAKKKCWLMSRAGTPASGFTDGAQQDGPEQVCSHGAGYEKGENHVAKCHGGFPEIRERPDAEDPDAGAQDPDAAASGRWELY